MTNTVISVCELCHRQNIQTTFHHLIPRAVHSKQKYRNKYSLEYMRKHGIYICKLCHDGLHDLFSEKELAEKLYSKELILQNTAFLKHVEWVKRQKC